MRDAYRPPAVLHIPRDDGRTYCGTASRYLPFKNTADNFKDVTCRGCLRVWGRRGGGRLPPIW